MTFELPANSAVNLNTLKMQLEPLPDDQVVAGQPATGATSLGRLGDIEVGVWEHSPGTSTDVEVDEFFIILSGKATIDFVEPQAPSIAIGAGDVVRLAAGTKTVWHVSESVRKLYIV